MMPIKKIAGLTLLVAGSIAVWVPQVRNTLTGESSDQTQGSEGVDLPLGDGSAPAIAVAVSAPPSVPPMASGGSQSTGEAGGLPTESGAGEAAMDNSAMRNFGSKGRSFLQRNLRTEEVAEPETLPAAAHFDLWLLDHPLTGVMQSPKGHRAIFGGQFYSEGQELLPLWNVKSIQGEFVQVEGRGVKRTVHLPRLGEGLERELRVDSSTGSTSDSPSSSDSSNSKPSVKL